jgi:hypothetical protein
MKRSFTHVLALFALATLISSSAFAGAEMTCTDRKSGYSAVITSECPFPGGAFEDTGKKVVTVEEETSTIAIYKDGALVTQGNYACSGVHKGDMVFFSTRFESGGEMFEFTLFDDWGLDSGLWFDHVESKDGKYLPRIECNSFAD